MRGGILFLVFYVMPFRVIHSWFYTEGIGLENWQVEAVKMRPEKSLTDRLVRGLIVGVMVIVGAGCGGRRSEPLTVTVVIDSAPESGAMVLMAGYDQGFTPVEIPGIEPGEYEVVLRQDRYRRKIETVTVTDAPRQTFTIAMEPIMGYLSVSSTPQDAEVYLDGEMIGKTPLIRKALQVGPYSYELRHPDHYPVSNSFVMEDNFKMEFTHEMRPMEAELTVLSRPSSASIWLNNIQQSQRTPAQIVLRPGRYLISVHSDGYLQSDEMVVLEANVPQTVRLEMTPGNVPQGMVLIPAGSFTMGSNEHAPDERPAREVHVPAFYIDRFEVTNQAFKQVFPNHKFLEGHENLPATGITWTQAFRYCDSLGKRLPTEAEWEKAARGTDARMYPWGDLFNPELSNTTESGFGMATRVGLFYATPSVFGTMDMAGNAYEWTADWYEAYPGNQYVTKDYGQIFRVLRGGSYLTQRFEARTTARHFDRMDSDRRDYGCRCAMNARE